MCRELSKNHSTHRNFSSSPLSLQPEIKAVTERPRVKHLCNLQKRESRSDRSYLQLLTSYQGHVSLWGLFAACSSSSRNRRVSTLAKGAPDLSVSVSYLPATEPCLAPLEAARTCLCFWCRTVFVIALPPRPSYNQSLVTCGKTKEIGDSVNDISSNTKRNWSSVGARITTEERN